MNDKQERIKEFIQNNPNLLANETLDILKKKGLGIRKTDFLKLYRKEKLLPEPTIKKQKDSIPIKYIKIEPKIAEKIEPLPFEKGINETIETITKKEGIYGVIEVIDTNTKESYWIKYSNEKDLTNQFNKIKKRYNIKKFKFKSHGFRTYIDFIDNEFQELLDNIIE